MSSPNTAFSGIEVALTRHSGILAKIQHKAKLDISCGIAGDYCAQDISLNKQENPPVNSEAHQRVLLKAIREADRVFDNFLNSESVLPLRHRMTPESLDFIENAAARLRSALPREMHHGVELAKEQRQNQAARRAVTDLEQSDPYEQLKKLSRSR